MLGLPLVPCHEFPVAAPAAFFSIHALKDSGLAAKLAKFIASGKPVLLTDGLALRLEGKVDTHAKNVRILPVKDDPKTLLQMAEPDVNGVRDAMLQPLRISFHAPSRVALYSFADGSAAVENFNDSPAAVELNGKQLTVGARGWIQQWK